MGISIIIGLIFINLTISGLFEVMSHLFVDLVWSIILYTGYLVIAFKCFRIGVDLNRTGDQAEKSIYLDQEGFEGHVGAVGLLKQVLNTFDDRKVIISLLISSSAFVVLHFFSYVGVGVFSPGIIQTITNPAIEFLPALIVNISIGFIAPTIFLLCVIRAWVNQRKWNSLLRVRETIIEGLTSATPIETWMVWRLRRDFWERVAEFLESIRLTSRQLDSITNMIDSPKTEVVSLSRFLTINGWLTVESQNEQGEAFPSLGIPQTYRISSSGNGFLVSFFESWNQALTNR